MTTLDDDTRTPPVPPDAATGSSAVLARPDLLAGTAAAPLLASGVGGVVFGCAIVAVEASKTAKTVLTMGTTAGSLTGKAIVGTAAFLAVWAVLHLALRGRAVSTARTVWWTTGLVVASLVLTFPPFFQLFAAAH